MIIYVNTGDYRSFGISSDLWGGEVIPVEVSGDFSGGGKTYNPETGLWIPDPPYVPTEADLLQGYESERLRLILEADDVMRDWVLDLNLGDISDADRASLVLWRDYKKAVKSSEYPDEFPETPGTQTGGTSTATDEE